MILLTAGACLKTLSLAAFSAESFSARRCHKVTVLNRVVKYADKSSAIMLSAKCPSPPLELIAGMHCDYPCVDINIHFARHSFGFYKTKTSLEDVGDYICNRYVSKPARLS
jgi:hypothetical protein